MKFFCHIVSDEGIPVNQENVMVIANCEQTKPASDIWSYLGLAGYYCQFIQDFFKDSYTYDSPNSDGGSICLVDYV